MILCSCLDAFVNSTVNCLKALLYKQPFWIMNIESLG